MLSAAETKLVVDTLTKRSAWIGKMLEDQKLEEGKRSEYLNAQKLLSSAAQKLTASSPSPVRTQQKPADKTSATSLAPPKSIAEARFLIAEDDPDSASLLVEVLADAGAKYVEVATDGMAAFDKIKAAAEPFHVILCDWDMPLLTGLDVHKKAQASNTLRGAHFMMVTAVHDAARIKQAVTQGVNDYIIKPIDIDVLEAKIKAALQLSN
ncbi:response regulator [Teredinibacter waterburyi]|jgi:Response regulators consisting of a CheY-like receiver domain and a winged-helix DNA-binding domain|uniref:response regulator n=1 Tax=Teredinibacter waterburyi TaxID=1500538 RepID=UPI00165F7356|nr:response regulator [Teredinibacter waterburyi]